MSQLRSDTFNVQWHNMLDQMKSDNHASLEDVQMNEFMKNMTFKPTTLGDEERSAVLEDVGTWAQLDDAGLDKQGVGLFFEKKISGQVCVVSIVPGCAADKTEVIMIGDELVAINQMDVAPWTLAFIRMTLQGKPGTFVILDLKRPATRWDPEHSYRVNIMRGSPQFIINAQQYGQSGAEKLNIIWSKLKEQERQYFRVHEKSLIEKARVDEALMRKEKAEKREGKLAREIERAKKELAHEEKKLESQETKAKNLKEGLAGVDPNDEAEQSTFFVS